MLFTLFNINDTHNNHSMSVVILARYYTIKQADFKKSIIPPPVYSFVSYLMEYAFTFTFASRAFPRCAYGALSVTLIALIGLVTLTFVLLTSKYVHGTTGYSCDGLSVLKLGRGTRQRGGRTDRETDRRTDKHRHHFIISPSLRGGA